MYKRQLLYVQGLKVVTVVMRRMTSVLVVVVIVGVRYVAEAPAEAVALLSIMLTGIMLIQKTLQ